MPRFTSKPALRASSIGPQVGGDHHQIGSEFFAGGKTHRFHSPFSDHAADLQFGRTLRFDDHYIAAALSQAVGPLPPPTIRR